MKRTNFITQLLLSAVFLVACTMSVQAQLDHNMIFRVNGPSIIAGDYNYGPPAAGTPPAPWGPTSINTTTGDLEWIDNNLDSLGCTPATNNLTGKVALARRGTCSFSLKAYHAQQAGAIGCVICNNQPGGGTVNMLGGDSASAVTIPVVFLTYEDCALLAQQVDAGTATNVSFYVPTTYNAISSYAYSTPLEHIQPLNGLQVTIYNTSSAIVNNVDVTATITDPNGASTVLTESLAALAGNQDSTVVFTQGFTPTVAGTYDIVFKSTLNTMDSTVQQFEINNNGTFALDNNNFTPSGNLGGVGPNDTDFAAANNQGTTFQYDMGATYLTGANTSSDANSITFALQNANQYVGKDFIVYLYEAPANGFAGNEQDYSTFNLIGGGLYTVQPGDTTAPYTLMTADLFDITTGGTVVPMNGNTQYMAVVSHTGDGSITAAPRYAYTNIQEFLSVNATTYVDRLFMAGWNPNYAPVIRLNTAIMLSNTSVQALQEDATQVFPVPTTNIVNLNIKLVEMSDDVTVKLINLDGKILQEHNYSNVKTANYSYNVKDLASGVYLLHVQTDHGQTMKKVVIK